MYDAQVQNKVAARAHVASLLRETAASLLSAGSSDTDMLLLELLDAIEAWQDGGTEPVWDRIYPLRRKLQEKLHVKALPDALEALLLKEITDAYTGYKSRGSKEPSFTAALLREIIPRPGPGWDDMSKAKQTQLIEAALRRLKTKGKLTTSTGLGLDGREARLWEPA